MKKPKTRKTFWTDSAKKDFEEIINYISGDSFEIATEKYEKIKKVVQMLKKYPEQGRIIPELAVLLLTFYLRSCAKHSEAIVQC